MRVKLENFRAFRETGFIDVKPINLLVGENSSGKTSFSVAMKFVYDIFSDDGVASFNSDPFFMGSFKDMTHYRGGSAGRAKSFSFHINIPVDGGEQGNEDLFSSELPKQNEREIFLKLTFIEMKAQAILSSLEIQYGRILLCMHFDKNYVNVSDGGPEFIRTRFPFRSNNRNSAYSIDLYYLNFILQDFRFSTGRDKELPSEAQQRIQQKVAEVGEIVGKSTREMSRSTVATAPVRTEPQRVYQVTERESKRTGNQAAYDLAQLKAFEAKEWADVKNGLEEFGVNAGLFRQINVRHLSKNKDGPFQIELKIGKQSSNIIDVGYGVSQALPLVFDLLRTRNRSVFFIQQPEIHLHPKAQVELASMVCEIVKKGKHIAFIETHSDFIIDRIRSDVRDKNYLDGNDVGVLFFKREDLEAGISQIGINKKGELIGVPEEYRSFFLREKMRSMGLSD